MHKGEAKVKCYRTLKRKIKQTNKQTNHQSQYLPVDNQTKKDVIEVNERYRSQERKKQGGE